MTHASNRRRRSLRLPGWDYRAPAYYFVTICTHDRQTLFDTPALCDVAGLTWRLIPTQRHARDWLLDEWVVMPNHLHGVLLRPTPPLDPATGDAAVSPSAPWPSSRPDWGRTTPPCVSSATTSPPCPR